MKFTKYNNPAKKHAAIRRKQAYFEKNNVVAVVMRRDNWGVVEKQRFSNIDSAMTYASTYENDKTLFADVRF